MINSMYCSCGQDAITCQRCGGQVCGNVAVIETGNNLCPSCAAKPVDPGCAYCHRGIDCEWHKGVQPELVFTYGTLMKGMPAQDMLDGAEFLCTGTIKGELVDLGSFPAALEEGEGTIHGELYCLFSADHLASLDRYEGCYSEAPDSLYVRIKVPVAHHGRVEEAWVYFYNSTPGWGSALIPSGDYRKHLVEQEWRDWIAAQIEAVG